MPLTTCASKDPLDPPSAQQEEMRGFRPPRVAFVRSQLQITLLHYLHLQLHLKLLHYNSLFFPQFTYAHLVLGTMTKTNLGKLLIRQKKAVRVNLPLTLTLEIFFSDFRFLKLQTTITTVSRNHTLLPLSITIFTVN